MARLAWSNSSDTCPIFLSCYELLFSLAHYHFLVALPEEVAVFVIWKEYGDHEEPEFKTQSPESANVGMVTYFLGKNRELRKDLRIEGMAELEVLDVKLGHPGTKLFRMQFVPAQLALTLHLLLSHKMSAITLRPATPDDLPAIAQIGIDTNISFPIYSIGLAPPADAVLVSLARTKHFFAQSYYHFTVAVEADSPAEVVAYICFKDGGEFEEAPFQPDLPEGANVAFMEYFLGTSDEHKNTLPIKGLPELEMLDVRTGYQRKGIGKMLVEEVVKKLDGRGDGCYVHSSKMGKGLYEKFGWRALDEKGFGVELVQFGEREPFVTWDMVREVEGAVGGRKEE